MTVHRLAPRIAVVAAMLATACGRRDAPSGSEVAAVPPVDAEARCRQFMTIRLRDLGPLEAIERCGPLFPPRCAAALATARADQSVDEGLAIIRTCAAEACPLPGQMLCAPRPSLSDAVHGLPMLARAIMANPSRRIVPGNDDIWRSAAGQAIAGELLPLRAVVVRIDATPTGIRGAIDGGGTWELRRRATADEMAALAAAVAAAGGDAAGALIWGTRDLDDDTRHELGIALGRAGVMEVVYCTPEGSNCR
ncbi:MAG: hypothetical protein K8W52_16165 [Deltaproteobacteria bacterium]|nr:hypothetical protein [Deltaproteobacteria bacterium]